MAKQTKVERNSDVDRDHNPEHGSDEEDERLLGEAARLETDCAGWTAIEQVGAAFANWVDDPDDPVYGVNVVLTGKCVPPKGHEEIPTRTGSFGATYMRSYRRVSGYKLIAGPTNTDGGTSETIAEWYGKPDQSPREVEHDIYLDVVRRARAWLHAHSPRSKRIEAILDGNGPDRLPEQEVAAGEGQETLAGSTARSVHHDE